VLACPVQGSEWCSLGLYRGVSGAPLHAPVTQCERASSQIHVQVVPTGTVRTLSFSALVILFFHMILHGAAAPGTHTDTHTASTSRFGGLSFAGGGAAAGTPTDTASRAQRGHAQGRLTTHPRPACAANTVPPDQLMKELKFH